MTELKLRHYRNTVTSDETHWCRLRIPVLSEACYLDVENRFGNCLGSVLILPWALHLQTHVTAREAYFHFFRCLRGW